MKEIRKVDMGELVREATALLRSIVSVDPDDTVFSTSFSLEDQVITDIIFSNDLPVAVFTLDTGRLFPETYSVWSTTLDRYKGKEITAYYPNDTELKQFVSAYGPNSFYDSVEQRLACCRIRKVDPLQQALQGKKSWITGIRRAHSPNRHDMQAQEWDEHKGLYKYHPLLEWDHDTVETYIKQRALPYNILHDQGFPSIGCMPCTRAVRAGEDMRAGRWWWESNDKKECGLHISTDKNR